MPEFEGAPRGFGRATLAFVGYVGCSFAVAAGLTTLLSNQWFLFAFLGGALVFLVPFVRLFRRLTPGTPGTSETD